MRTTTLLSTLLRPMAAVAIATMSLSSQAAGLLTPADGSLPALEIRQHDVDVTIEDAFAITEVTQIFHNPHAQDLEAVYSFPVPEKAAVAEFTMWIDGKPVIGEVLEKKRAREVYEQEKAAGREAGLTEKNSYKSFDISVSPVRAGQDTKIRMVYLQPIDIDTGIGRYVYPLEEGGTDQHKLAFWTANDKITERFSFDVELRSSYPVDAVRLPSHPMAQPVLGNDGIWSASMSSGHQENEGQVPASGGQAVYALDKDIVVYWRHQAGLPGSVDMVTHRPAGANKGTFMLTLTPGDDLKPITEGSDWMFVLDLSGSMQDKYASLTDGVLRALGKMRPEDRFRIILFNESATELTNGYVTATHENVKHYSTALLNTTPGGGTNLYAGLKSALQNMDADRTSSIVLVTDGVANVGETAQRKFLDLLSQRDARLFTFVMGNSANRPMLQTLTRESNGFAVNISNSDDIVGKILEASSKVTHEAMHGVELDIDGIRTSSVTPENIGSLYRGDQLIVFGHYHGSGQAEVTLKAKVSGAPISYRTRIDMPAQSDAHPEIERLWAYARISDMMERIHDFGEDADTEQAITDLAIEYDLVTDYTSMIVLRDEVFQSLGIDRKNAKRRELERAAEQARKSQAPTSNRVDQNQPMFSNNRASHGSGSMGVILFALMVPALLLARRKYR